MFRDKLKTIFFSPAVKDLLAWAKPVRLPIFVICLFSVFSTVGNLTLTMVTKGLVDGACGHDREAMLRCGVALASIMLLLRGMHIVSGRYSAKVNGEYLRELRTSVLRRLLRRQYTGLDGYHSGELVNRFFSDISVVKDGVMGIIPSVVSMAVSLIGASAILFSMDWRFLLLMALAAVVGAVMIVAFKVPMKERHKKKQEAQDRLHAFIQESLENLRIIKASGSEGRTDRRAWLKQTDFLNVQMDNSYFSIWMNTGISMVFQISWLVCMLWGCFGIYQGKMSYGSLAAILQLVNYVQGPIAGAAGVAAQAYGTVSSAERLKEILDLPDDTQREDGDAAGLYEQLQAIRFRDVTFAYENETILEHLDCEIRKGDFVALTGESGGGKSTMFQLLLGLYQPDSGSLKLVTGDGVIPEDQTRALLGYVPQGNYLFSGTLRENLTMFTDGASDEEIMEAADTACIGAFIRGLENGLDTELGERGLGLSEGQAQRIAVARVLLSKAPILLLDESTSALDEQTEAELLENISKLKNKTCIIVTHRRAARQICDYRLHLENKTVRRITERGETDNEVEI